MNEEMKSILEETEILWNDRKRLEQLEKENKELKGQVEWLEKCKLDLSNTLGEANKQIEELKERLRIESQSLHEQCEIVGKQVEQIEKMKCCGNCKWNFIIGDYEPCNKCNDENDKWECVE